MRIIFVPQFPTKMRYQEWWFWKLPEEFEKAGHEVITLGKSENFDRIPSYGRKPYFSGFAPVESATAYETEQIQEYLNLRLRDDDILFLADLSFPGFFANVLHHKPASRMYAFCHATSMNYYDYFQKTRHSKFQVERGQAAMFKKIFVGSHYHKDKLAGNDWPTNLVVTGLPSPPETIIKPVETEKKRFIMSAARPSIQKVDLDIERMVEEQYNTQVYRKEFNTWQEYCQALSESKILLVTSREETFGYQVVDAILNGCVPVVPNAFSYPELVPRYLRYDNLTDLLNIIDEVIAGHYCVPKLLCETRIKNFYSNIIQIMEGVKDYPF
jgi:hypothetical protein